MMTKKQLLKEFEKLPVALIKHALDHALRLKRNLDYQNTAEYAKFKKEEDEKKAELREMWLNSPG